MRLRQFPHFPRIFSAHLVAWSEGVILWIAFTALLLANIYARLNLTPLYWDTLLTTLDYPGSYDRHLRLAQAFWQEGLISSAKQELRFTSQLQKKGATSVLGASSVAGDLLSQWEEEPNRLQAEYQFWQKVIRDKPAYRDAYIKLGSLAYQLSKFDEAKIYLTKATNLDPNSEIAHQLFALVSQTRP